MDLKHFTDETLHKDLQSLFQKERTLLMTIIYYLREIQSRKMFSSYKYESMQDYLVLEFGLSEDQAWRRIDVIKLLEELPELEEKIKSGEHTLTNLNLAHALFKKEEEFTDKPFAREEKLEILGTIEKLPSRPAKKILLGYSSVPSEMVKVRKLDLTLDELANNDEIQGKLKKLKGLLAHSDPDISMMDLINKLCDLGVKHWDPGQQTPKKRKPSAAARSNSRYIPLAAQREVWARANSCCENCEGTYALQIEHIIPIAVGGGNDLDNLKLLCRNCNLRSAINFYGKNKMDRFLRFSH